MKGINIFLADGFEDVEALATNDVLRRGGLDVNIISIYDETSVVSSHGINVEAGFTLDEVDLEAAPDGPGDFMIFPGGMPGTRNLASCEPLMLPAAPLPQSAQPPAWCSASWKASKA